MHILSRFRAVGTTLKSICVGSTLDRCCVVRLGRAGGPVDPETMLTMREAHQIMSAVVTVVIPKERATRQLIHRTIEFVINHGTFTRLARSSHPCPGALTLVQELAPLARRRRKKKGGAQLCDGV
jgi:hypothetical protein